MLTEHGKKGYVGQADMRWQTRQPEICKNTIGNLSKNHLDYMKEWRKKHQNYLKDYAREWRKKHQNYHKDYMAEWNKKHPDYLKEWKSRNKDKQRRYREVWSKKHPNYMKDYMREWSKKHPNYMKEWKSNVKGVNAGSILKIEGVDLAVVSEPDNDIFRS